MYVKENTPWLGFEPRYPGGNKLSRSGTFPVSRPSPALMLFAQYQIVPPRHSTLKLPIVYKYLSSFKYIRHSKDVHE